jgi:Nucleotide-diphospho-sugar transferase
VIASDIFYGDPYSVDNMANGGFIYAKSCNKTIEFFKFWYKSRERFPGHHDQDVFNAIKADVVSQMKLRLQFLETHLIGTFCQLSHDLNKICTLHADCCVGLENKLQDLKVAFEDWKNFTAKSTDEKRWGNFRWTVPGRCIH